MAHSPGNRPVGQFADQIEERLRGYQEQADQAGGNALRLGKIKDAAEQALAEALEELVRANARVERTLALRGGTRSRGTKDDSR
jgi:DNA-binding ferritin-like protein